MRYFISLMIGAAVLATAVVSVRLHLLVAGQRYGLASLMEEHARADRALRRAHADLEALKAPRKLMDRWAATQAVDGASKPAGPRPVPPVVAPEPAAEELADTAELAPTEVPSATPAPIEDAGPAETSNDGEPR